MAQHQTANCYTRPDGVVGYGFEIEFAGRDQHSIAWPDRAAERFKEDELTEHRIRCEPMGGAPPAEDDSADAPAPADSVEPSGETPPAEGDTDAQTTEPSGQNQEPHEENQEPHEETTEAPAETPPADDQPVFMFDAEATEADNIRNFLRANFEATNDQVVDALAGHGMKVSSSQVTRYRREIKKEREAAAAESEQS